MKDGNPLIKPPMWAIDPGVVAYNCSKHGFPIPVLAMPFWEGTGNKTYDVSGNMNNGTMVNHLKWIKGSYGFQLSFDGTDDYIPIPGNPPNGEMTIISMIQTNVKVNSILEYNEDNPPAFNAYDRELSLDASGHLVFRVYNGAVYEAVGTSDVADGKYHSIAGRIHSTIGNSVFVDGVLENTNNGGTNGDNIYSSAFFHIGAAYIGYIGYFNGINAYVLIFKMALTDIQIKFFSDNPYFIYETL